MLLLLALLSFAACVVLGKYLEKNKMPHVDLFFQHACFGRGTPVARYFTELGYSPALIALFALFALVSLLEHWPLRFSVFLVVAQVLSQRVANQFKRHYKRLRPVEWLLWQEATAAYPSGHATTAVVVFGGTAFFLYGILPHPAPAAAAAFFCAFFIIGIPWSRMVLGAHHFTDLLGGALLGTGTLSLLFTARAWF